jgi:hypothetical protein
MSGGFDFFKRLLDEEENQNHRQKEAKWPCLKKLNFVLENNFKRVSYTEAIDI